MLEKWHRSREVIKEGVGYFLGTRWQQVAGASHDVIIVAAVALAAILAWMLVRRRINWGSGVKADSSPP